MKVKLDLKELQRQRKYEEALSLYAQRYAKVITLGDHYMGDNLFEEMFGAAVRLVNETEPSASLNNKLADIRTRLAAAIDGVGGMSREALEADFERNFDRCRLKLVPKEFQRRQTKEEPRGEFFG